MRSHRPRTHPVSTRTDAEHGTVVAPHEQSVQAGLDMYERGGNVIDAAVAAALVAGVIEPTETTLAGSGFLLFNDGEAGKPWSVNFGPKAPLAASPSMYELATDASSSSILGLAPVAGAANINGAKAPGVPRTLLGLLTAQDRWGKLDRSTVCQAAIRAAYDGFPADTWFMTSALSDLTRLRSDEQCRRTFLDADLPIGHASQANYGPSFDVRPKVTQPILGATLEEVAHGPLSALTSGTVAQRLVETSQELGGLLSLADMRTAGPDLEQALTMRYRDFDVSVPTAPGGGITELQILAIWEALNPTASTSHESPEHTRRLALAIRHAFADRYHWLGDPNVVPVPTRALLSRDYVRELAALCEAGEDVPGWSDGAPWLTYAAHAAHDPWPHAEPGRDAPEWSPAYATPPSSGTTHISAADPQGHVVSITHTAANHFGSGVLCPRTGLLLDSAMAWFNAAPGAANSITPGARALANMGPALLTRDGRSVAALGASGGRRIISAITQVLINLVDGQCTPEEALERPRIEGSGSSLLVPQDRVHDIAALSDLGVTALPTSNEPFPMDFARPNIAGYDTNGEPVSAISSMGYGD